MEIDESTKEESFQTLKEKLCTTPVLAYPDFEKEFILYTDASGYALGAVLSQKDKDGKEHVIYYASKSLTDAEKNYSTTELECYAVVWAVEKFHYYLDGRKFKVVTDHYALKWLKENSLKGRRARWLLKLQPYDMEVIYRDEIDSVLWMMHNHPTGGHFGTENTYKKIKERFYWQNMKNDIKQYI